VSLSFKEQNDLAFASFLDRYFIDNFKKRPKDNRRGMEIIITADCNLECKYCYLQKRKEALYPQDIREPETILKNIGILFDWIIKNGLRLKIDLFSGEIFSGTLGLKVLWLIYDKYKNVPDDNRILRIMIPTNMSFLTDAEQTKKVVEILEKLKGLGITVSLSASIDGKHLEINRPYKKQEEDRNDEYYETLFQFLDDFNVGCHPMVSSMNIAHWKENYQWYIGMLDKYRKKSTLPLVPMMLEVRDDDWTDETIKEYLAFLDYVVNNEFARTGKDVKSFAHRVFVKPLIAYDNVSLIQRYGPNNGITCAIQKMLYVRAGDLAIVPCHRTMYDPFILGRFVVKNDEIVGVEGSNVALAYAIHSMKGELQPGCEDCAIEPLCTKGCLGSQFESTGDLFVPAESVCRLYKARTVFLLNKYLEMGILQEGFNILPEKSKETLARVCREVGINA